jgi:hypothetical protein
MCQWLREIRAKLQLDVWIDVLLATSQQIGTRSGSRNVEKPMGYLFKREDEISSRIAEYKSWGGGRLRYHLWQDIQKNFMGLASL